uniref:Uncharacterized protein n=1 Tax=Timema shepardi TaxID=629360 RepID=A0A7R9ALW7_TIMSH|nr:unnamed protein product [Timema shepardi]
MQRDVQLYRDQIQALTEQIQRVDPYMVIVSEKLETSELESTPSSGHDRKAPRKQRKATGALQQTAKSSMEHLIPSFASATYADIAAGRTSPCPFADLPQEEAEENTMKHLPGKAHGARAQVELVEPIKEVQQMPKRDIKTEQVTRLVVEEAVVTPTVNLNLEETQPSVVDSQIATVVSRGEKSRANRRGRSPRRKEAQDKVELLKSEKKDLTPVTNAADDIENPVTDLPKEQLPQTPTPKADQVLKKHHHIVLKQSQENLKPQIRRERSPSPMWLPGSTTYADILRGKLGLGIGASDEPNKYEEVVEPVALSGGHHTEEVEEYSSGDWGIVPQEPHVSTFEPDPVYSSQTEEPLHVIEGYSIEHHSPTVMTVTSNGTPDGIMDSRKFLEQEMVPPVHDLGGISVADGMFEYIQQPPPDLVGFIASGQQLLNSGLGTYHSGAHPYVLAHSPQAVMYPSSASPALEQMHQLETVVLEQGHYEASEPDYNVEKYELSSQSAVPEKEAVPEIEGSPDSYKAKKLKTDHFPQQPELSYEQETRNVTESFQPLESLESPHIDIDRSHLSYAQILALGLCSKQLQPSSQPNRTDRSRSPRPQSPVGRYPRKWSTSPSLDRSSTGREEGPKHAENSAEFQEDRNASRRKRRAKNQVESLSSGSIPDVVPSSEQQRKSSKGKQKKQLETHTEAETKELFEVETVSAVKNGEQHLKAEIKPSADSSAGSTKNKKEVKKPKQPSDRTQIPVSQTFLTREESVPIKKDKGTELVLETNKDNTETNAAEQDKKKKQKKKKLEKNLSEDEIEKALKEIELESIKHKGKKLEQIVENKSEKIKVEKEDRKPKRGKAVVHAENARATEEPMTLVTPVENKVNVIDLSLQVSDTIIEEEVKGKKKRGKKMEENQTDNKQPKDKKSKTDKTKGLEHIVKNPVSPKAKGKPTLDKQFKTVPNSVAKADNATHSLSPTNEFLTPLLSTNNDEEQIIAELSSAIEETSCSKHVLSTEQTEPRQEVSEETDTNFVSQSISRKKKNKSAKQLKLEDSESMPKGSEEISTFETSLAEHLSETVINDEIVLVEKHLETLIKPTEKVSQEKSKKDTQKYPQKLIPPVSKSLERKFTVEKKEGEESPKIDSNKTKKSKKFSKIKADKDITSENTKQSKSFEAGAESSVKQNVNNTDTELIKQAETPIPQVEKPLDISTSFVTTLEEVEQLTEIKTSKTDFAQKETSASEEFVILPTLAIDAQESGTEPDVEPSSKETTKTSKKLKKSKHVKDDKTHISNLLEHESAKKTKPSPDSPHEALVLKKINKETDESKQSLIRAGKEVQKVDTSEPLKRIKSKKSKAGKPKEEGIMVTTTVEDTFDIKTTQITNEKPILNIHNVPSSLISFEDVKEKDTPNIKTLEKDKIAVKKSKKPKQIASITETSDTAGDPRILMPETLSKQSTALVLSHSGVENATEDEGSEVITSVKSKKTKKGKRISEDPTQVSSPKDISDDKIIIATENELFVSISTTEPLVLSEEVRKDHNVDDSLQFSVDDVTLGSSNERATLGLFGNSVESKTFDKIHISSVEITSPGSELKLDNISGSSGSGSLGLQSDKGPSLENKHTLIKSKLGQQLTASKLIMEPSKSKDSELVSQEVLETPISSDKAKVQHPVSPKKKNKPGKKLKEAHDLPEKCPPANLGVEIFETDAGSQMTTDETLRTLPETSIFETKESSSEPSSPNQHVNEPKKDHFRKSKKSKPLEIAIEKQDILLENKTTNQKEEEKDEISKENALVPVSIPDIKKKAKKPKKSKTQVEENKATSESVQVTDSGSGVPTSVESHRLEGVHQSCKIKFECKKVKSDSTDVPNLEVVISKPVQVFKADNEDNIVEAHKPKKVAKTPKAGDVETSLAKKGNGVLDQNIAIEAPKLVEIEKIVEAPKLKPEEMVEPLKAEKVVVAAKIVEVVEPLLLDKGIKTSKLGKVVKAPKPEEGVKASKPEEVFKASKPEEVVKASKPEDVKSLKPEVVKSLKPEVVKASKTEEMVKAPKPEEVIKSSKSEEVIKSSKSEEVIKSSKSEEVIKASRPEEVDKTPKPEKVVKAPKLEVDKLTKPEEVVKAPKREEVVKIPKSEEVVKAPKPEKVAKAPKLEVDKLTKPEEVVKAPKLEEVDKLTKPEEIVKAPKREVVKIPKPEEIVKAPKPEEVAKAPKLEKVVKTPKPEEVAKAPKLEKVVKTPKPEEVANAPKLEVVKLPKPEDVVKAPKLEDVVKAPKLEVVKAPKLEVVKLPKPEDVVKAPKLEEVVKLPKPEEVAKAPKLEVVKLPKPEDVVKAPKLEVVKLPKPEEVVAKAPKLEVVKLPTPEKVAKAPKLEKVVKTPKPEEVSKAPKLEVVKLPKPEEVIKAPKLEEVVKTPKPEEVAKTPKLEVVKAPKLEEVDKTPKPEKVAKAPKLEEVDKLTDKTPKPEKVSKAPKPEEVVKAPKPEKVVKAPKLEEVDKTPKPEKVSKAPKLEEIDKLTKPEEVVKAPKLEEVVKAPKPEKVAKAPKLEEVDKTPKPEKVSKAPKLEEAVKAPKLEEVVKLPKLEEVDKTAKPEKVVKVPKLEEVDKTPKPEKVVKISKPVEVVKAPKPEKVAKAPKLEEVVKAPKPEKVAKAPKLEEVDKTPKPEKVSKAPKPEEVVKAPKPEKVVKAPKPEKVAKAPKLEEVVKVPKLEEVVKVPKLEEVDKTPKPEKVAKAPKLGEVVKAPKLEEVVKTPKPETVVKIPNSEAVVKAPKLEYEVGVPKREKLLETNEPEEVVKQVIHPAMEVETLKPKESNPKENVEEIIEAIKTKEIETHPAKEIEKPEGKGPRKTKTKSVGELGTEAESNVPPKPMKRRDTKKHAKRPTHIETSPQLQSDKLDITASPVDNKTSAYPLISEQGHPELVQKPDSAGSIPQSTNQKTPNQESSSSTPTTPSDLLNETKVTKPKELPIGEDTFRDQEEDSLLVLSSSTPSLSLSVLPTSPSSADSDSGLAEEIVSPGEQDLKMEFQGQGGIFGSVKERSRKPRKVIDTSVIETEIKVTEPKSKSRKDKKKFPATPKHETETAPSSVSAIPKDEIKTQPEFVDKAGEFPDIPEEEMCRIMKDKMKKKKKRPRIPQEFLESSSSMADKVDTSKRPMQFEVESLSVLKTDDDQKVSTTASETLPVGAPIPSIETKRDARTLKPSLSEIAAIETLEDTINRAEEMDIICRDTVDIVTVSELSKDNKPKIKVSHLAKQSDLPTQVSLPTSTPVYEIKSDKFSDSWLSALDEPMVFEDDADDQGVKISNPTPQKKVAVTKKETSAVKMTDGLGVSENVLQLETFAREETKTQPQTIPHYEFLSNIHQEMSHFDMHDISDAERKWHEYQAHIFEVENPFQFYMERSVEVEPLVYHAQDIVELTEEHCAETQVVEPESPTPLVQDIRLADVISSVPQTESIKVELVTDLDEVDESDKRIQEAPHVTSENKEPTQVTAENLLDDKVWLDSSTFLDAERKWQELKAQNVAKQSPESKITSSVDLPDIICETLSNDAKPTSWADVVSHNKPEPPLDQIIPIDNKVNLVKQPPKEEKPLSLPAVQISVDYATDEALEPPVEVDAEGFMKFLPKKEIRRRRSRSRSRSRAAVEPEKPTTEVVSKDEVSPASTGGKTIPTVGKSDAHNIQSDFTAVDVSSVKLDVSIKRSPHNILNLQEAEKKYQESISPKTSHSQKLEKPKKDGNASLKNKIPKVKQEECQVKTCEGEPEPTTVGQVQGTNKPNKPNYNILEQQEAERKYQEGLATSKLEDSIVAKQEILESQNKIKTIPITHPGGFIYDMLAFKEAEKKYQETQAQKVKISGCSISSEHEKPGGNVSQSQLNVSTLPDVVAPVIRDSAHKIATDDTEVQIVSDASTKSWADIVATKSGKASIEENEPAHVVGGEPLQNDPNPPEDQILILPTHTLTINIFDDETVKEGNIESLVEVDPEGFMEFVPRREMRKRRSRSRSRNRGDSLSDRQEVKHVEGTKISDVSAVKESAEIITAMEDLKTDKGDEIKMITKHDTDDATDTKISDKVEREKEIDVKKPKDPQKRATKPATAKVLQGRKKKRISETEQEVEHVIRNVNREEVLCQYLPLDGAFWPDKWKYHNAERRWQELVAQAEKRPSKDKPDKEEKAKEPGDRDDDDNGPSSGHSSPGPRSPRGGDGGGGGGIDTSSFITEHLSANLPGGICSWKDETTYLSSPNVTLIYTNGYEGLLGGEGEEEESPLLAEEEQTLRLAQRLAEQVITDLDEDEPDLDVCPRSGGDAARLLSEIKVSLTTDLESLQRSVFKTENDLSKLPTESLDSMLEALVKHREDLRAKDQEVVRLDALLSGLPQDVDTQSLGASLTSTRTRIITLLSQAEQGKTVIEVSHGESCHHGETGKTAIEVSHVTMERQARLIEVSHVPMERQARLPLR